MIGIRYTYLHLAVFCAVLFFLSVGALLFRWGDGLRARRQLEALTPPRETGAEVREASPLPGIFVTGQSSGGAYQPPARTEKEILPEYQALYAQNHDLIGWIEITGTLLNLPVMYTPEDREYYLRRLFDGSGSQYGVPFLDGDCSVEPRSTNLILHGHHMTDGTMFSTLANYRDEAFFRAHPEIRFDTIYEKGRYEIIAVFLSVYDETDNSPDLYYNFIDARDEQDFDRFISQVRGLSLYDTGKTASYGDELITLITCMYDRENGRMNVVARKTA